MLNSHTKRNMRTKLMDGAQWIDYHGDHCHSLNLGNRREDIFITEGTALTSLNDCQIALKTTILDSAAMF